jgi:hypothetical protein
MYCVFERKKTLKRKIRFKSSKKRSFSAESSGKVMLWNIKKVMHCHFSDLSGHLSALIDPRKFESYTIEEMVMSAIVLFIPGCNSRNAFNNKAREEMFCKNYRRLFGLELPHMDATNDLFKSLDFNAMEEIRCCLISMLIEKRVFHKFRFFQEYSHIAIDGTGTYNWSEHPPEGIGKYALKKESKNGKQTYFTLLLEAVLICKNGMTVPLMTEWIANDNHPYDKQDCESKGFKRMAVRLKKYFPRLGICILADGLYSNASMMNICQEYGWKYMTVFKDGNLPSVWEEVGSLLPLDGGASSCQQHASNSTHWITRSFRWIKDIQYQKYSIHWIECVQEMVHRETGEKSENRFVFLTNMDVNSDNIADILMAGRARWLIEEHFNTQKNRGGNLHHKYSRNNFNAIKNWHNTRQLAYLIKELVKHSVEVQELLKSKKLTWKELWEIINGCLYFCSIEKLIEPFENWCKKPRQIRLE